MKCVIACQYFSSFATFISHQRKAYANKKAALCFCHCNMKHIVLSHIKLYFIYKNIISLYKLFLTFQLKESLLLQKYTKMGAEKSVNATWVLLWIINMLVATMILFTTGH